MSRASARSGEPRVWVVECDEYRVGPFIEDVARRSLADIQAAGHCRNEHRLVKIDA